MPRTLHFLLTDIEGSTRHWEREPDAMRLALARHDAILRQAVSDHRGEVMKGAGDGIWAVFDDPEPALLAAVQAQRQIHEMEWATGEPLRIRIALHRVPATDIEERDDDFFGPGANRCARLVEAAHGGQVIASEAFRDATGNVRAIGFRDLGAHRLRDLREPERIHQVTHPDLPATFPALRSLDAYPTVVGRTTSPTFVGRRSERARLAAAFERAAAGEPSIMLIGGDAGIGKTRLLTEFVSGRGDGLVLTGGCLELGEAVLPYAPVVEALRELTRELGAERVRTLLTGPRRELSRLLPSRSDTDRERADVEPSNQSRLFEAVLSTLETLGADRPVVLAIEDLHWADRSTLDLVVFLARNLDRGNVLVVATYRTDDIHRRHTLQPVLAELSRVSCVERLDLVPFDRDELAEQLTAILGHQPDDDLVDEIAVRSEGNAFYAEELLAAAERSEGRLPPTLRDILASRLAPLPETAKEVVRVAAAAGRAVDHQLLEEVAEVPAPELRDGLREAVAHQVLVTTADGRSYRFRHALVQEAVHDELLPGERTRLHATFAEALTRDPSLAAAGPEGVHAELAHHWYAAHELDRAFTASLAAADNAVRLYAFAEAQHHYELVLEIWDRVQDTPRQQAPPRHEVLRRAAQAAGLGGGTRRAVAHLRAAISEAGDDVPPEVRAGLLGELSRGLWAGGQGEEALAASEESLDAMPEEPSRERAFALAWRGRLLMLTAPSKEAMLAAIEPSREAVEVAREVGARLEESQALNSLGTSTAFAEDLEAGVAHLQESLRVAEEVGSADDVLRAYINLNSTLEHGGRSDEAIRVGYEGITWAEDNEVTGPVPDFLRLNMVDVLYFLGRWEEADAQLRASRIRPDSGVTLVHLAIAAGRLRVGQGRFDEAREHLRQGRDAVRAVVDPQFLVPMAEAESHLAVWEGRPEDARRTIDEVLAFEDLRWHLDMVAPLAARAEADTAQRARAAGDGAALAEAARRLDGVLGRVDAELAAEDDDSWWAERLRDARANVRAERTRLEGEPDPDVWAAAVERADEHRFAEARVYLRWRHAETLLELDRRDEAAQELETAHGLASELGARPLREEIEALARRGRVELPGVAVGDDGQLGLTPREREVLELVAEGLTNREIGERLYIAEKTASVHVSNILAKLDVSNRVEAAGVAHRLGLDTAG
ncbi:MAG: AAA family ATPase [Actinobacteria bacterium]|nr:AAA family ATPase [Actinomycetota bacterium]